MATTPQLFPVPTPYQPPSKGGNPYLQPGTTGPMLPASSVPTQSTSGGVQFNTGQTYPASSVNTSYTPPQSSTQGATQNWATQQSQPVNIYTTYKTINGETKKIADWMNEGKTDSSGNILGGGGGGKPSVYISPEGQQFGSQQEYMDLINKAYNASMGYLNQNEQVLGGAKTAAEKQAEADYQANLAQLGTQKGTAIGGLETQQRKGQTQKEDALAQARRLFNELQRGNVQRFGGATSAGQAASEIQGAEQQRQFGQTARQFNEFTQQIETARRDVESQYQTGMQQLQQSKQQAMAKIQSDLTNAIMQINNMRAQTETQKGAAKLQALMQLRSEAQALQNQATQFEQQLALMREQANLNIQQYAKTTGAAATTGSNALMNFNPTYDNFSTVAAGTQFANPVYSGQIGKSYKGKDYLGRTVWVDSAGNESYGWTNPQQ